MSGRRHPSGTQPIMTPAPVRCGGRVPTLGERLALPGYALIVRARTRVAQRSLATFKALGCESKSAGAPSRHGAREGVACRIRPCRMRPRKTGAAHALPQGPARTVGYWLVRPKLAGVTIPAALAVAV